MTEKTIGQIAYEVIASAVWNEAVEACAKIADKWGRGEWKVEEKERSRFSIQDLQLRVNTTGRGIAEDIRSLKRSDKDTDNG